MENKLKGERLEVEKQCSEASINSALFTCVPSVLWWWWWWGVGITYFLISSSYSPYIQISLLNALTHKGSYISNVLNNKTITFPSQESIKVLHSLMVTYVNSILQFSKDFQNSFGP